MEKLLTYVWKHKLMLQHQQTTTDGCTLEIIDPGLYNSDAGPDFFNAKVRIDGVMWAGNVEIHTKSSDWFRHHHEDDPAYNSVILHVVGEMDREAICQNGHHPSHYILSCPEVIRTNYSNLTTKEGCVCHSKLSLLEPVLISSWKSALMAERLERKTSSIVAQLERNKDDWEEVLYQTLGRYFGFGINNDLFEQLIRSIPLSCIRKHRNNLLQIEALFFGQAGLLVREVLHDRYAEDLKNEYEFLQHKFGLVPLENPLWKMLRIRPDNFPHVRIAELAAFVQKSENLFSKIIEAETLNDFRSLFKVAASRYWDTHFSFTHESPRVVKSLGKRATDVLIINVAVPLLFIYGRNNDRSDLEERAFQLLESLPPEQNYIIYSWSSAGMKVENAFDSQALIQLQKEYCDVKKCLCCRFGHKLLTIPPLN
ncbi:MAG: DUF2851 family protein [Bacteroidales bacterium]|nr:DUF2851 family protein [Bacteroidales bacterium]MDD4821187.1 DUF2851 family protein [Bacteroidales bacterium]